MLSRSILFPGLFILQLLSSASGLYAQKSDTIHVPSEQIDSLNRVIQRLINYRYDVGNLESNFFMPDDAPRPFITIYRAVENRHAALIADTLRLYRQVQDLKTDLQRLQAALREKDTMQPDKQVQELKSNIQQLQNRIRELEQQPGTGALRQARDSTKILIQTISQLQRDVNLKESLSRFTDSINRQLRDSLNHIPKENKTTWRDTLDIATTIISPLYLLFILFIIWKYLKRIFNNALNVQTTHLAGILHNTETYICQILDIKRNMIIADVLVDAPSRTVEIRKFEARPITSIIPSTEIGAYFLLTVQTGPGLKNFKYSPASEEQQSTLANIIRANESQENTE